MTAAIFVLTTLSLYSSTFQSDGFIRQRFSSITLPWQSSLNQQCGPVLQAGQLEDLHTSKETGDWLEKPSKAGNGYYYPPTYVPQTANQAPRAKAGFIVLARNSELDAMRRSMKDVEYRFNRKYGYPWIFLNNEPFSEEFKRGVQQMTRSNVSFGLVPKEQWSYPDWISESKAADTRVQMKDKVPYGDSESYRHMCRYQSGFFFRHPLTLDLDYYWRVEPGIELHCDIDYDPFVFMAINNKTYGFTIALNEFVDTVATLYDTTREFVKLHPEYVQKNASMRFLTEDPAQSIASNWNLCHFWSNFEIGDLRFWRSKEYLEYFDYLDRNGGFFYERWGDAPVHSIAAALFLDKSRIHHFDDIGYFHHPWLHCPSKPAYYQEGKCSCNPEQSFDRNDGACLKQWQAGVGIL
ncbi:hypothetical protein CBS101457_004875 [Exobasidium rhododendri]|nr:hypothetical protein CBS101457_004875 [Exobasidium rhododendri]